MDQEAYTSLESEYTRCSVQPCLRHALYHEYQPINIDVGTRSYFLARLLVTALLIILGTGFARHSQVWSISRTIREMDILCTVSVIFSILNPY